ncbi:hypothetical protein CVT26_013407 [Gymnopilus dilepis]|uniref:Uncharacterized protein n=1 Tax=Gymnopilus dilepis TaxID=231916 RepID=A0A409VV43_9AGAR|nr:hypothetical protein CVT26_013407 [Gymnopilus dilepis]
MALGHVPFPDRIMLTEKPAFQSVVQMITEGQNISVLARNDDQAWSRDFGDDSAKALPKHAFSVEIVLNPLRYNRYTMPRRPNIGEIYESETLQLGTTPTMIF